MSTDGTSTPDDGSVLAAVDAFRVLGHRRRLRVMQLFLHVEDTLCGCEIADIMDLADYQVSRDLSSLRSAGLVVANERTGTWIHYQLPAAPKATIASLLALLHALPLEAPLAARLQRRLAFRETAGCVLGVGDPEVIAALDGISDSRLLSLLR